VRAPGAGGGVRGHRGPAAPPRPLVATSVVARAPTCVEGSKGGGDGGEWW
jgi:hypothetical protein